MISYQDNISCNFLFRVIFYYKLFISYSVKAEP